MSKAKGYFKVYRDLLASRQFNSLSASGKLAYLNLRYFDYSDGKKAFKCPYRKIQIKISRASWWRGISELQTKNFILIIPGEGRAANSYMLTDTWRLI